MTAKAKGRGASPRPPSHEKLIASMPAVEGLRKHLLQYKYQTERDVPGEKPKGRKARIEESRDAFLDHARSLAKGLGL